jgi:hypothetical protein
MGICPPQRIEWLRKTLDYMDGQQFPFYQKVLCIDEFDGYRFPVDLHDKLLTRGWAIVKDSHRDRVKSMEHGLKWTIDSDVIFYNEDDVMATLPTHGIIDHVFNDFGALHGDEDTHPDRSCGMLSMALGGTPMDLSRKYFGDIGMIPGTTHYRDNDYRIFQRLEHLRTAWFVEFPGLFIRAKVLKKCMKYATEHFSGEQVEMGLTKAWFALKMDKYHFKLSIAKADIAELLVDDPHNLNTKCRFLENLDPHQGQSPLGGKHSF